MATSQAKAHAASQTKHIPVFANCHIALAGNPAPGVTQVMAWDEILKAGGTNSITVCERTTHLVVSDRPLRTNSKVKAAKELGIEIVTYQWILDSLVSRRAYKGYKYSPSRAQLPYSACRTRNFSRRSNSTHLKNRCLLLMPQLESDVAPSAKLRRATTR